MYSCCSYSIFLLSVLQQPRERDDVCDPGRRWRHHGPHPPDPHRGLLSRERHQARQGECCSRWIEREREKCFIYGYMVKDHSDSEKGNPYRLTARVLLYAPSHRQDSTYHSLCYTSRGALAGTRNSAMGPPHEGSIRQPIAP